MTYLIILIDSVNLDSQTDSTEDNSKWFDTLRCTFWIHEQSKRERVDLRKIFLTLRSTGGVQIHWMITMMLATWRLRGFDPPEYLQSILGWRKTGENGRHYRGMNINPAFQLRKIYLTKLSGGKQTNSTFKIE